MDYTGTDEKALQPMIEGVAQVFLQADTQFSLYSEWCANYSTALRIIGDDSNVALTDFLTSRCPSGEQAFALQV